MNIREKMHSGDLYLSMDEDLFNEQLTYLTSYMILMQQDRQNLKNEQKCLKICLQK